MSKKTIAKHIALTVICSAVPAACGGSGSPSTDLVGNATAARNVINMIEALDEAAQITQDDKEKVEAAQQSYNRLTDSQKSLVSKKQKEKLDAAVAALAAAGNGSSSNGSSSNSSSNGSSTVDISAISDNNSLPALNTPSSCTPRLLRHRAHSKTTRICSCAPSTVPPHCAATGQA